MPEPRVHLFGVRHHGPGSARSLAAALTALKPDAVLIEGPPDAADILPLAADKAMRPPVALLIYDPDRPKRAVFYPFAVFSPEWTAIGYALKAKADLRFIDLPVSNRFAIFHEDEPEPEPEGETPDAADPEPDAADPSANGHTDAPPPAADLRRDPLHYLAMAAGDADGERWWDRMVESRRASTGASSGEGAGEGGATAMFAAVHEAMAALRAEFPKPPDSDEAREEELREAHMRRAIRAAIKEGYGRIAVVCGAWHTPALSDVADKALAAKDNDLLSGLPKVKTRSTWIPWTHSRLCAAGGYGAGVQSPGWYEHLWTCADRGHIIERWMTRVARLLREKDLDASSAHIIESVRLAETLATIRGRTLPGLDELNESTEAVFTFGNPLPLRLIHDKLIVGEVLGQVPASAPAVPLQRDIERLQTSLRLKPSAEDKPLDLDLRNATDLARSHLLHRLSILNIEWGRPDNVGMGRKAGTFHEYWRLQWRPEFAINIVEAGAWGNTVEEAATAFARHKADTAPSLAALTAQLDHVLLAQLPDAADHLTARIASVAAVASDVGVLMDALPALARVSRYGNVRKTDAAMVDAVLSGLTARICVGLPPACVNLSDDAAAEMLARLNAVEDALATLARPDLTDPWRESLRRAAEADTTHARLRGRAWRILLDTGAATRDEAATRMSLALSRAVAPAHAAAWLEGFLAGSGLILLHDRPLWDILDAWVTSLKPEQFDETVPLLRRAFSTFERPERRQMGELVKRTTGVPPSPAATGTPAAESTDIDLARAELVLPTLDLILGPPGVPQCSTLRTH